MSSLYVFAVSLQCPCIFVLSMFALSLISQKSLLRIFAVSLHCRCIVWLCAQFLVWVFVVSPRCRCSFVRFMLIVLLISYKISDAHFACVPAVPVHFV
jgi:hypothetical protein